MIEWLLLVVLGVFTFRLRSIVQELQRRLAAHEAGLRDLRNVVTALGGRTGSGPAPRTGPSPAATPVLRETAPGAADAPPPDAPPTQIPPSAPAAVPTVLPTSLPSSQSQQPSALEQQLGTRWTVWIGGLALALGGLLLVRYSIEQGLIGPELRIVLGALLAAVLAGAGETMRRHERAFGQLPAVAAAHIPSVLTSAGTVVAFGTTYAAHALYGFIGPGPAFVLLGAIALSAMLGAALHGPALAGVGLLGAYAVPLLVSSSEPNPWPVVIYLAVVALAAYALARVRRWLWLAGAAVAGAVLWGFLLLATGGQQDPAWITAVMTHTAAQLALAAFFMGIEPHLGRPDEQAEPDGIAHAALAALVFLVLVVLAASVPGPASRVAFAALAIAMLGATGLASAPAAGALLLGGVVAIGTLLLWPGLEGQVAPAPAFIREAGDALRLPADVHAFLVFAGLASLGLAIGAAWRMKRGTRLPAATAALLAAAATLPPLAAFVVAYLRVTQFDHSIPFALAGLAMAAAFAAGARSFLKAEGSERPPQVRLATGALAAAAIAALALALTCGLERGYLTVAFALAALGAAYVSTRSDIPLLRYAVAALGLIVLARVAIDPRIMGASVGTTPILNWLLFGYGVPAAAFALAARLMRPRGDDLAVRLSDGLAVLFTALLASFEIRHLLYAGDVLHRGSGHVEMGLQATAGLGLSYALSRLDLARANPVFRVGSMLLGLGAAGVALIGLGLVENPLLSRDAIGGSAVFSSLLLAYLLPGLVAVLVARSARRTRPAWYALTIAVLAVLLIVAYVTLEVRHAFQGPVISWWRTTGGAEHWAYSVAWLVLGIVFLGYGLLLASKPARIASAALIVLAVVKVFLFDLAGLSGLWRALSFISLGAVLMGIGLVYQRLLFPSAAAPQPPPAGSGGA